MEIQEKTKFNILIVDDNPKNIQVIGNILREANYMVGFATDGAQAIRLLQNDNEYDLVLLDVEMPVMDGFETCKVIRQTESLKEIPVIFLTAFTDVGNVIKGFESGAQDYITKPFNSQELLARVWTHLQLKYKSDIIRNINIILEQKVEERTEELQKAISELNSIDIIKSDYLIFISQEIRTPLDGIIGTINLIKNQELSSTIRNLLETLETSVSKLEEYTYKTIFLNQISQRKYQMQCGEFLLHELLQFAILEYSDLGRSKNVRIIQDPVKDPILINGDKDLLFKAFTYILENAVKFTPNHGRVTISLEEKEGSVFCLFMDSGNGFAQDILKQMASVTSDRIENSFTQKGLSLYIVRRIMELHHGNMVLSNNPSGGACVELQFKL